MRCINLGFIISQTLFLNPQNRPSQCTVPHSNQPSNVSSHRLPSPAKPFQNYLFSARFSFAHSLRSFPIPLFGAEILSYQALD